MTTLRKNLIIVLAVLGMGSTTLTLHAEEAGRGAEHAKWGERAAMHQKQLHDLLKLTPSQETAWGVYMQAVKPMHDGDRMQHEKMSAVPAPARMEQHIAMAKQHIGMMESHLAALNTFYSVLTPEQKKIFDEHSMHQGGHHMGHHKS